MNICVLFQYKIFRNRYRYFFRYQFFSKPIPILFSIPHFFETNTDTFFDTKNFRNRYRYHQKNGKVSKPRSFETETSHSDMEAKRLFSSKGLNNQANKPSHTLKNTIIIDWSSQGWSTNQFFWREKHLTNCYQWKKWQMLVRCNNVQNLPQTSNAVENSDQDFTFFCFSNCASFPCSLQKEQGWNKNPKRK